MMRGVLVGWVFLAFATWGVAAPPDFDREVSPIFLKCLDCHTGPDSKKNLDLSRKAAALESIVPGKPSASVFWTRIEADEMPPKKPLSAAEKATLKAWIEAGAKWGRDPIDPLGYSTPERAGRDWWALQPVRVPALPEPKPATGSIFNPIDRFVLAKLETKGLKAAPLAEPRTRVRRLYADLVGLPPPPEAIAEFEKNPSREAYEQLVDRLLASPQYGERFARHWLDLVRYGESDGFERNAPRPNAWHYRDWIIASLNSDMPYDRFAKLQLAGDGFAQDDPSANKATGFLVAGIHNTVLGSNAAARQTARQDELEDIIAAVGQTFLGLTVQCARCHDHKFDPITQTDYYRMTAALSGVLHGERTLPPQALTPVARQREVELEKQLGSLKSQLNALEEKARKKILAREPQAKDKPVLNVTPIARWTFDKDPSDEFGSLNGELRGGARVERGRLILDGKTGVLVTKPLKNDISERTLEVWLTLPSLEQRGGGAITIETANGSVFDSIVFAEKQPGQWMAGSNFFKRTRELNALPEAAKPNHLIHLAIAYAASGEIAVYRNGKPYGKPYIPAGTDTGLRTYKAGDSRILIGQRHTGGGSGFLRAEIEEARLYGRALTAEEMAESAKFGPGATAISPERLEAELAEPERQQRREWLAEQAKLEQERAALQVRNQPEKVFAVVSGSPGATHLLARGDVTKKRAEVSPGGVASIPGEADFQLKPTASDVERRVKLAEWIARPNNPLFTRTIANRLWQQHFGTGLVDTASDFGFNGARPSHPELLDWLAAELVRQKFSLKSLHKLIVTSATYQQANLRNDKAMSLDTENRWLWRKSPVRVEAEVLRDSILAVAGQLNPKGGGPGFADVRTQENSGTTYYFPLENPGPETHRRTIYRFSPRGERSAVLETFDCPDPSSLTPRRQTTTTPLQALALWNNSFVLTMANHFAERVTADCRKSGNANPPALVNRAYALVLGRTPNEAEAKAAVTLVEKHGLAPLARVLFNCNEFVVIE